MAQESLNIDLSRVQRKTGTYGETSQGVRTRSSNINIRHISQSFT